MKVAIIGTGYVGLTTGVCLADIGHEVFCVDNNPQKLEILKEGRSPIFEPGMEELLKKNTQNGRLSFSSEIASAAKEADVIFICVNTPTKENGMAELKFVEKVAKEIALAVGADYKVIVDKSTVPVKTAEKVKDTIHRYGNASTHCDVVSNPEFLKEGTAIFDTMEPDRIVIGSDSEKATNIMVELYKPIIEKTGAPVRVVSVRSAELIKHGANTFLSIKISYANLISQAFEEAHELGMFTVLWCYLRNDAFKKNGVDYHASADLTGQANHLGVTIEADIIKQKLPTNNGGFVAIDFGKTSPLVYKRLTTDHPIDLARYQVANCYMGRIGLINSGGASGENDLAQAVRTAVINKRAGGTGLISGRKAFQKPMKDGIELLNAIQDVYLDKGISIA